MEFLYASLHILKINIAAWKTVKSKNLGIFYGSPLIPSHPDLLKTSPFSTLTLHFCNKQHLKLISWWTDVVSFIFKTTRRNWDMDIQLRVQNEIGTIAKTFSHPGRPLPSPTPPPFCAKSTAINLMQKWVS